MENVMLGVNKNRCSVLYCKIPFNVLKTMDISIVEAINFSSDATNWGGCDDIERTLELNKYKLTGDRITLNNPIKFRGYDYDMGKEYSWEFEIFEILEIENIIK